MGFVDKLKISLEENKKKSSIQRMVDRQIFDPVARVDKSSVSIIAARIKEENIDYKFPKSLLQYMSKKYPYCELEDVLEVFIRYEKSKFKEYQELKRAKKIGITKIKIKTSQDSKVCPDCKKHSNKTYDIDIVPRLPLCWECRCYYEPQV